MLPMSEQTTAPDLPAEPAPTKTRLRDRALGFRAVVAVTLAGVVLGGLGGTALGFALDGDQHDHPARVGGRFGGGPGPEGGFAPPGVPQGPPGTAPQEQTAPDGSGDTSGSSNS